MRSLNDKSPSLRERATGSVKGELLAVAVGIVVVGAILNHLIMSAHADRNARVYVYAIFYHLDKVAKKISEHTQDYNARSFDLKNFEFENPIKGIAWAKGKRLKFSISVNKNNHLVASFVSAPKQLLNKQIVFKLEKGDRGLYFACVSSTVAEQHLPGHCRSTISP